MNATMLNATAAELKKVKAQIKELEKKQTELEDAIKAAMVDLGTEKLNGDGWAASWINVNRSTFDTKSFKADHGDLYAAYSRPQVSTRFTFSEK